MGVRGLISLRWLIVSAATIAAVAALALAQYHAMSEARSNYPLLALAQAVRDLASVSLPDYVRVYTIEVHYIYTSGRWALEPGPSPPNCSSCIPPRGWLYSVSFGANATPPFGATYTVENATLLLGESLVVPPYWENATLLYLYPACRGGFNFKFQRTETFDGVALIIIQCS